MPTPPSGRLACGVAGVAGTLTAMATWGGTREFFQGPTSRWDFPDIDDESPATPQSATAEDEPARIPSRYRMVVAGVIGVVIVACAIAAIGVLSTQSSAPAAQSAPLPVPDQPVAAAAPLLVHVSGAVNNPGVLELEDGARVFDAVDAAGGVTSDAEANQINLARPVMDGEHIVIPREGETPRQGAAATAGEPISLSRSPADVLVKLPGVGPALAARIVSWREEHGGFGHVDDVLAVAGIGSATLEGFRDQVVP